MKTVNIGLLGLGIVGTGTYKILSMNKESISSASGKDIKVSRILEKNLDRDRGITFDLTTVTDDPDVIFNDPEVDIVVEALGGIEPSTSFMLSAMKKGKHVITSNKAAVAANYHKLTETARENNVEFRFEASVGGGIPILNALTTVLKGNEFIEIMGIVNGTTNYILTQMTEFGLPYDEALKAAQEKGFAEADPTADVEGIDAANKLTILMALAFGEYVAPEDIPRTGISKITARDIEDAKAKDCKIKLIAGVKKEDGKLIYSVKPTLIPVSHPLAGVSNEFNAVYVTGNAVDQLMFYGRGAGSLPTGSAIVGDIIEISKLI